MLKLAHPTVLLALVVAASGCPQAQGNKNKNANPPPAGTTCGGNDECPPDQVCTQNRCRYRKTSAAGEVLVRAAESQLDRGDHKGAERSFEQAIDAYEAKKVPVPPRVLCGAAVAALQAAGSSEAREHAAHRADLCLRNSLPGDPSRQRVLQALSRLRYEGLDVTRFDQKKPADRYFTKEPQRPTVDQIELALDLPEADEPAYEEMSEALNGEDATRAIADCFVEDWELNHRRKVRASLMLKFESKLRDMGHYDVYEPEPEVKASSGKEKGFAPCVAKSLTELLGDAGPRNVGRTVEWQKPFEIAARLQ